MTQKPLIKQIIVCAVLLKLGYIRAYPLVKFFRIRLEAFRHKVPSCKLFCKDFKENGILIVHDGLVYSALGKSAGRNRLSSESFGKPLHAHLITF